MADIRMDREHQTSARSPNDDRNQFQRDYGRIIHSPAFRRLQGKSQVFGAGSGDYYRTRLTHSLEVAQIAGQIAHRLQSWARDHAGGCPGLMVDPMVVQTAALAHDIGHPPFGHLGERTLHARLSRHGHKFEGNAQNLQILMFLEKRADHDAHGRTLLLDGLNLTAAVLLAINKYPVGIAPDGKATANDFQKGVYGHQWSRIRQWREQFGVPQGCQTIESQVMDLADDIAYSTHDIEDGIRAGKVNMAELDPDDPEFARLTHHVTEAVKSDRNRARLWGDETRINDSVIQALTQFRQEWLQLVKDAQLDSSRARRELKALWVNRLVNGTGCVPVGDGTWFRVTFLTDGGDEDLEAARKVLIFKKLAWVTMVSDIRVQRLQVRGERIVRGLWSALYHSPPERLKAIMPSDWTTRFEHCQGAWTKERYVADYIAGMTDAYASQVYSELFGHAAGGIYDRD